MKPFKTPAGVNCKESNLQARSRSAIFGHMTKTSKMDILAAAGALFREKGYAATTIRDIAVEAGIRLGSLHYRYPNKIAILEEMMGRGMEEAMDILRKIRKQERDPEQRIKKSILAHVRLLVGGTDDVFVLLYEWRSIGGRPKRAIIRKRDAYEALWAEMLRDAVKAGVLKRDLDLGLLRRFVLGGMNWFPQWFSATGSDTPEALAEKIWEMLSDGIAQRKDKKLRKGVSVNGKSG